MKQSKLRRSCLFVFLASLALVGCGETSGSVNPSSPAPSETTTVNPTETPTEKPTVAPSETPTAKPTEAPTEAPSSASASVSRPSVDGITDTIYSVKEAIDFANAAGEDPSDEYVVQGVITNISHYSHGERTIADVSDESISLHVYGVRGADGETYFNKLETIPQKGDTVYLKGALHTHKGTSEIGLKDYPAKLLHLDSTHEVFDDSNYTVSTIADARSAAKRTKVKITGVVAKTTRTQKFNPNGLYLVDATGSIYVYGGNIACQVVEGNTITVAGETDLFIDPKEQNTAAKIGYKGAIQVSRSHLISNDKGNTEFPKNSIKDKTRKEIVETDITKENITGEIFHTKAIIKKSVGASFVNYYINDLDQKTGTYTYTGNSGKDFSWLDTYLGQVVDLYVGVTNCKSTSTGAIYRVNPITVSPIKDYAREDSKVVPFVYDYYVKDQFLDVYSGDPKLKVKTSHSDSLLGISDVNISYSSNNTELASFVANEDGKTVLNINKDAAVKTATLTRKVSYKDQSQTYTKDIKFVDVTPGAQSVSAANSAADGVTVKIRGIVASSILNKNQSFYVADDNGVIACLVDKTYSKVLNGFIFNSGDEVVLEGIKRHKENSDDPTDKGQAYLEISKFYGVSAYDNKIPNPNVITNKTFADLHDVDRTAEYSRQLYSLNVYYYTDGKNVACIYESKAAYDRKQNGEDVDYINIYKGGYNQVAFLKDFESKEVTMTFALCNWNNKTYATICPFSATDGTKTAYNTFSYK